MRVAIVAPPFIPVPPIEYGGTELFIADLALGLKALGFEVIVYTNGANRALKSRSAGYSTDRSGQSRVMITPS